MLKSPQCLRTWQHPWMLWSFCAPSLTSWSRQLSPPRNYRRIMTSWGDLTKYVIKLLSHKKVITIPRCGQTTVKLNFLTWWHRSPSQRDRFSHSSKPSTPIKRQPSHTPTEWKWERLLETITVVVVEWVAELWVEWTQWCVVFVRADSDYKMYGQLHICIMF